MNESKYQPIIGIEVHVELRTKSKMFCPCPADHFQAEPNSQTCPVCLGLPGALPVPNQKAIEDCILIGLALGCQVNKTSFFERKNYFYPDLAKGYQISQYQAPLCQEGRVKLSGRTKEKKKTIRINRVHMEEETAKMIHQDEASLIDFNRSGVPLVEIVSEPDISGSKQAVAYLKKIQQTVRYLGVSDCDMEKGSMRCEANISLARASAGGKLPDYRVEIKNVNSFKFVKKALDYEIKRQTKALDHGQELVQETRGFNEDEEITYVQRAKEAAHDYRYFPEPDIPPMRFSAAQIFRLNKRLPELPDQKIKKFREKYSLSQYQANLLASERSRAEYFEQAAKAAKDEELIEKVAKTIINRRLDLEKYSPAELVKQLVEQEQSKITDRGKLSKIGAEVLAENPSAVADFKAGKTAAIDFLIGQVMAKSKGKADAQLVKKTLVEKLKAA